MGKRYKLKNHQDCKVQFDRIWRETFIGHCRQRGIVGPGNQDTPERYAKRILAAIVALFTEGSRAVRAAIARR